MVKRFSKIALTLVVLFSSVEFVISNILFYTNKYFDPNLASLVGNSGSILALAVTGLVWLNVEKFKESN